MLRHESIHLIGVGDIGFEKFVAITMFLRDAVEVREIAGIGQNIDIAYERRLVMLQNIPNKVAPNEPTAAGHENAHRCAY
jgi:hypothetical protein